MKTKRICSYAQFVANDRPYYPVVQGDRLIICDFQHNTDSQCGHHRNQIAITHVVVLNSKRLTAIYACQLTRFGYQPRWFYFCECRRVTWHGLSMDDRISVVRAFLRVWRRDGFPDGGHAPTKNMAGFRQYVRE